MDGGGQKVAWDLCRGLQALPGVEVDLGLLGCRVPRLESQASFVIPYAGDYSSVWTLVSTARRLRRILRLRSYDVVHTHGWDADIIARWALSGDSALQVIHLHVTPGWILSSAPKHQARRLLTRHAFGHSSVRVVTVSDAVRLHWGVAFPRFTKAMRVVHNGVDVGFFRPPDQTLAGSADSDKPFVFGIACRLAPMKGLSYLLEALGRLRESGSPSLRLDIGGEGSERERLETQARQLGLEGWVRFLGPISPDAMPTFYQSLDALVLPSVSDEGLPLVVLEAMACGLPVVATDVGGTREAVRSGVDGWVVPPRDPEALASALLAALQMPPQDYRIRSQEARARVCESFSLQAQAANVLAVYGETPLRSEQLHAAKAS